MKKILIITHNQFGYQINTYKYAQYLKKYFDISYFCFDYGKKEIIEDKIDVAYVDKNGLKIKQLTRFMTKLIVVIRSNKYDLVINKYFPLCSITTLFYKSPNILAIQTGSVSKNKIKNNILNYLIKYESKFYKNVIILSESLRKALKLPKKGVNVIPLGSEVFSDVNHKYDQLDLLYVGTLNNRNIEKTIKGFKIYINNNSNKNVSYKIIGFGTKKAVKNIIKLINDLNLNDKIEYIGLVPYNELHEYFNKSNIGISFVPKTPYFDVQPPTKTIEYLLSGLPVIATATTENQLLVNHENGILIDDSAESFAKAIKEISKNTFDNRKIRESMEDYKWKNIVINKVKPIIEEILEN